MSSIHVTQHPLLLHKLSYLRKKDTTSDEFRRLMGEVSRMLCYEVTRDFETQNLSIETPLEKMQSAFLSQKVTVVSIMRAGNGMLEGFLQLLPFASVGHVGIYRDDFIRGTVEYYFRLPKDIAGRTVLLLDPMLASGATAVAAITRLKEYGVRRIRLVSLIAAPQGVENLKSHHPDVELYTISIDRELNSNGYILPGIGDAGDRLFDGA